MTDKMIELANAAADYKAVQDARGESLARLQAAIRAADAEQANRRADIIRLSGVARQTVYDALREPDPEATQPPGGPAGTTTTGAGEAAASSPPVTSGIP